MTPSAPQTGSGRKHRTGHSGTSPSPSPTAAAQGSPDSAADAAAAAGAGEEEARVCARRSESVARRMRWTRREGGMPGVAGGRWSPARGGAGGTAALGVREEAAAAVWTVSLEITGAVEPVGALRSFRSVGDASATDSSLVAGGWGGLDLAGPRWSWVGRLLLFLFALPQNSNCRFLADRLS